jgi:hypothetical protein
MQTVKTEDFLGDPAFDEMACASCGNEISGKLWVCEQIASAVRAGIDSAACIDRSLIC